MGTLLSRNQNRRGVLAVLTLLFMVATISRSWSQDKPFDCIIKPRLEIKLATPIAGVLKEVPVDRGDRIRKGDVLARLESGIEKALLDLAEARAESDATVKAREARLKFLTKKRERILELQGKGAASKAALDEVESDYGVASEELREAQSSLKIAQLDVARASEVLKQRSILSPIDGVVSERNLLGGEYAYEQAHIVTIAQIDPLNVEIFVPVALHGAVSIGMEAIVFGEQPVGGRYTATVEVIDPLIDSRSGTFGIRLLLPNPDNKIPAGLRCKVEFPLLVGSR